MADDEKMQEQNPVVQALTTEGSSTNGDQLNQKGRRKRRIINFPTISSVHKGFHLMNTRFLFCFVL